jgi:transposase InsO family protein
MKRHEAEGIAGLADQARGAHHCPHRISDETMERIIAARHRWKWGPRKLRVKLSAAHPEVAWPAASTIGEVLKRAGLTHRRRRHTRTPPATLPFASVAAPNQTWCADFKGWFRTGDGTRCDPLTITDAHSRYLLRCHIAPKTDGTHVAALFDAAFREYGLPLVIHTDNGVPFASVAPGGLSCVSMRWVKLGITPDVRALPRHKITAGTSACTPRSSRPPCARPSATRGGNRRPSTDSSASTITSARMRR